MAIGTVCRRYQVPPHVARALAEHYNLRTRVITVRPIKTVPSSDGSYIIVYRPGRLPAGTDTDLAHLCGTAETRYILGASGDQWHHPQARAGTIPDAYWHLSGGRQLNVEYDTGTYDRESCTRKLCAALDQHRPIVWAASTLSCLSRVRGYMDDINTERAAERQRAGAYPLTPPPLLTRLVAWHSESEWAAT